MAGPEGARERSGRRLPVARPGDVEVEEGERLPGFGAPRIEPLLVGT